MPAFARGDIVASGGSLLLVWSLGENDLLGVPIRAVQGAGLSPRAGEPLRRALRSAAVQVGKAAPGLLASAREAVAAMRLRAENGECERIVRGALAALARDPVAHRGRGFWDGAALVPGCFWVRAA
jgi:hypothetical protein